MCGARFGQALAFLGGFRWLDAVRLRAILPTVCYFYFAQTLLE